MSHKIQINYKSGISMVVKCSEWTVRSGMDGLLYVSIENPEPHGVHLGMDHIESIWEL